jgi:outer membrane protein OmpA-like peptidoglycan-associated protein
MLAPSVEEVRMMRVPRNGSAPFCVLALLSQVLAAEASAQQVRDRFIAESTSIAQTLFDIEAQEAAERVAADSVARLVLTQPILFARGSVALDDSARLALNGKAWYLYNNASLTIRLTGRADSGASADTALLQSRARVDSVRRYLAARGVELDRIRVDESEGGAESGYGRVAFAVQGAAEVVYVPPATAAPPPEERVRRLDGTITTTRFRWATVRVFYATDRRRGSGGDAESFYAGERCRR